MEIGQVGGGVNSYQAQNIISSEETAVIENALVKTLNNLKSGDLFKAQVTDIHNSVVKILLSSGETIQAKLGDSVNLNIGQDVIFQVKSNSEGVVTIKPFMSEALSSESLLKVLEGAGLPATDKNIAIIKELMNEHMPLDKNVISDISKFVGNDNSINLNDVVNMSKLGVSLNAENLETFSSYENYEHRISGEINTISKDLQEFAADKEIPVMDKALVFSKVIENAVSSLKENPALLSNDGNVNPESDQSAIETGITLNNTGINNQALTNEAGLQGENNINNPVNEGLISENNAFLNADTNVVINEKINNSNVTVTSQGADNTALSVDDKIQKALGLIENAAKGNENAANVKNAAQTVESNTNTDLNKLFSDLNNYAKVIEDGNSNELQKLFSSDKFKNDIREAFKSEYFIDPEKFLESKDQKEMLTKLYKKLLTDSSEIAGVLEKVTQTENKLYNHVKEVSNNVSFMNELNAMAGYVQIPLKLSMGEAHSELYVYNKNRKINPGDPVSAFLHLDLDHLGATDIFVKMQNGNVNLSFSLADEEACKIIDDTIDELKQRINDLGYNMTYKSEITKKDAAMPFDEFGNDVEESTSVKRYTFDMRA